MKRLRHGPLEGLDLRQRLEGLANAAVHTKDSDFHKRRQRQTVKHRVGEVPQWPARAFGQPFFALAQKAKDAVDCMGRFVLIKTHHTIKTRTFTVLVVAADQYNIVRVSDLEAQQQNKHLKGLNY